MWLRNIKDVYRIHRHELDSISTEDEKANRLVELNVQEQVFNPAKLQSSSGPGGKSKGLTCMDGYSGLKDGIIKPVFEMKAGTHIDPLYEYDDL